MKILGIETSCDETSASVVEDGVTILSNVIASQVEIHARFGGIVPEVASRQHILQIAPIIREALSRASLDFSSIDAVAATVGPGLAGSLLVGANTAKAIAYARQLPLIGVNHLEGHIYANWLKPAQGEYHPPEFPVLCLIASGGHTDLVLMKAHGDLTLLGRTRDDAAGEAFDKIARILGLGYPGGPVIEKTALTATKPVTLPRASIKDSFDFSFSGLKTAGLHMAMEKGIYPASKDGPSAAHRETVANIAAGFQAAVVDMLVTRTAEAATAYRVRQVLLAGGVAANKLLRQTMLERCPVPVSIPGIILCTDNAAMIASAGYFALQRGLRSTWAQDVIPNLRIGAAL